MLACYGHPFSSYTWKVLIALYACDAAFDFRMVGPDQPDHAGFVAAHGGPWGKFPVVVADDVVLCESTTIIEYLATHHPGGQWLLSSDPEIARGQRLLDRILDQYVMAPMQAVVDEYLRAPKAPDADRCAQARARLERSYAWVENGLATYAPLAPITLVECAAAPALFYADWVKPIGPATPRLAAWRAHLLALPEVARCVEAARPWRPYFPPGAPDRD